MKKHLHNSLRALFLSLAVLLSLPMLAVEVEINGINYDLDTETDQATVIAKSIGTYSDEVVIPESVEHESVAYSVTGIGQSAFQNCSGLTSVTIPNSVTSIGQEAFAFCEGLTSVTIPNSVTSIGKQAFDGCSGLTSVTIPNSVKSIGVAAFSRCSGLTSIVVEEGNPVYDSRNNCNAIIETATNTLHSGCQTTIIPNSVTSIGGWAFNKCSGLTSVTIPNSVTSIGVAAFQNCYGLTSVTIPNSVTSMGDWAFGGCSGLTSVIIPNSVTSIGNNAFQNCSGLTSVTIPNSVESIGERAFWGCSGLTSVTIGNSVTSIGYAAFYDCSGLTSVTIPNSVTSIGDWAFANCSKLLNVYCYAENVPSTGSNAFSSSPIANATLHVPDASINSYKATEPWSGFGKIVALLNYEFDAETKQATVIAKSSGTYSGEVVIPESVEHESVAYSVTGIGDLAFYACSGLTSVTIPNSVTSIGERAFEECTGLTSVHISDIAAWCNIDFGTSLSNPLCYAHHLYLNGEEVKDLVIPNSVTSIGNYAFDNCSGLTSVTIPNSVTRIGDVAFWGCSGLTSVTIPNSVTSIGQEAFRGCSGLTSVTIPNSVTSIGSEAFRNCSKLLDVYCYAENVPSTGSNAFSSSLIANATLHVPAASINSYEASAPWSDFGTVTPLPDLTLTDGEEFENNTEQPFSTLTYTRTLPNMLWNPLYVPFKIPYEDLEENYEVAYINAMHSYDNDDNGEIDEMVMEIVKIKAGTLKPNHPYLIKAKNEEAKVMNIVQEAATLYPAEITTLDCSSVYTKFEITGTYQEMTSGDLNGSLVISTDGAWKKLSSTSTLKPFRFYLTISSREGSPVEIAEEAMSRVRIRVMGEDDNATGIDEVKTANDEQKSEIYDLSGRRVSAPAKGGVYVINGKKVIY